MERKVGLLDVSMRRLTQLFLGKKGKKEKKGNGEIDEIERFNR